MLLLKKKKVHIEGPPEQAEITFCGYCKKELIYQRDIYTRVHDIFTHLFSNTTYNTNTKDR